MAETALTERQAEVLGAIVNAWEASGHAALDFPSHQPFAHPQWPSVVHVPTKDELRPLRRLGMLRIDPGPTSGWSVSPTEAARSQFGDDAERQLATALRDADQRLGLILRATVEAFEQRPDQPLALLPVWGGTIVRHSGWQLQPDVVRMHDIQQLHELGLLGTAPQGRGCTFWPTSDGRAAVHNAPALLESRSELAVSDQDAARLRSWAERLRAGDIAVSVLAGTATSVIRALIGL